ncbi:oxidoreductase [Coprinopsis sp. MPI-PUGE-AT-0042]|nr:oxidoreductase [Coprinopsis sp. MPI-PUGE-AT-0042]
MAHNTPTIKLNDGNEIPWVGFGTGTALYGQDAADSVRLAIETGVVHLDGAQVYRNEDSLGAGIKASGKPRSELWVTTKLSPLVPEGKKSADIDVKATLKESLQKLGLDFVDLFLIHSPHPANEEGSLQHLWRQMEEVKNEGLAKSIGVSNFRVEDLKTILETAKIVPAVNQIELHPYVWKAAKAIYDFDKEHGIVTASYSGLTPLTKGAGGPLDGPLENIRARLEKTRGEPVTAGQVLTKWLSQKGAVVITTTSKATRIREFQDTVNLPELTEEEVQTIESEGSKLHKRVYMLGVFKE